ncbi:MAG: alpha-amylase [Candidatus Bathyarchaeota archaeon B26-2]|nr:MAG: alpha-amylase [Candidatus Bathyarchaeota archaeon B26-2]
MHILGLRLAGYVSMPKKGYYTITEEGKGVIGLPTLTKEQANSILREVSPEKAFHFYVGLDQPLGFSANSLSEFCEKIQTIDLKSIEFHMARGDFELWIHYLGDVELAKRLRSIRESGSSGEDLRKELYETLKSRFEELKRL